MSVEQRRRSRLAMWEQVKIMKVHDHYLTTRGKNGIPAEKRRMPLDYSQPPQGQRGKIIWWCFTVESVVLLGCLTVSLLILPLVLPPLPPPPSLLLLLPILILAFLMFLAFMPSTNSRHDPSFTYA